MLPSGRIFGINTRGCCFICLGRIISTEKGENSDKSSAGASRISDLLQYLKLDIEDTQSIFELELELLSDLNDTRGMASVTVQLCENCRNLIENVSKLINVINVAEMEVSYHLSSVHQKISNSGRAPSKMKYYRRQMKNNDGCSSLTAVDNLRDKLLTECSRRTSTCQQLRVALSRTNLHVDVDKPAQSKSKSIEGSLQKAAASQIGNSKPQVKLKITRKNSKPRLRSSKATPSLFATSEKNTQLNDESSPSLIKIETEEIDYPNPDPLCPSLPVKVESTPVVEDEVESDLEFFPKCTICQRTFSNRPSLSQHMEVVHGSAKLECPNCKRIFPQSSAIYQPHVRKCSAKGKSMSRCKICSKGYASSLNLAMHYKSSHPDVKHETKVNLREHVCDICGKIFYSGSLLNRHRNSVHSGAQYSCSFSECSKKYCSEGALILHWRRKHGGRRSPGDTNQPPKGHSETNQPKKLKKKEPTCKICSQAFPSQRSLWHHRRLVHFKGTRYKCDICGQDFSSSEPLANHMEKVHLNNLHPFQCKVEGCGKVFGREKSLQNHEKNVHLDGHVQVHPVDEDTFNNFSGW